MELTLDTVTTIAERLKNLPQAPEAARKLTTREAIARMRPQLSAALKKGYTHDALADMLQADGLTVSAATLKKYLRTGTRKENPVNK